MLLTGKQVSSDILYQIKLHTGALSVRTDVRVKYTLATLCFTKFNLDFAKELAMVENDAKVIKCEKRIAYSSFTDKKALDTLVKNLLNLKNN